MLDPFLPPPPFLARLITPLASFFNLQTLPLHAHEVLVAFAFYLFTQYFLAPFFSRLLIPKRYAVFPPRTKLNWDVHFVSFVQSCVVNGMAFWIMWADKERGAMDWRGRVWGYTGAGGMIQGFAAGYFLWDLCVCGMHVGIFGWGMLAHAVAALAVFSLGFRPFVNFYAPTFILYELSSPFLNIHWFCDKLSLTGSRYQLVNGILLLATFFLCRLVWGTYQSVRVYQDVWAAIQARGTVLMPFSPDAPAIHPSDNEYGEVMRFAGDRVVPVWLASTYLGSNVVLNTLNFYWFGKMIETVRKRFRPQKGSVGAKEVDGIIKGDEKVKVKRDKDGETVTVEKTEVRRRRG